MADEFLIWKTENTIGLNKEYTTTQNRRWLVEGIYETRTEYTLFLWIMLRHFRMG